MASLCGRRSPLVRKLPLYDDISCYIGTAHTREQEKADRAKERNKRKGNGLRMCRLNGQLTGGTWTGGTQID